MKVEETLRGRLHEMVDELTTQQELERAIDSLAAAKPVRMATEDEERRIGLGRADVAAGKVMSLDEFRKRTKAHIESLKKKSENENRSI